MVADTCEALQRDRHPERPGREQRQHQRRCQAQGARAEPPVLSRTLCAVGRALCSTGVPGGLPYVRNMSGSVLSLQLEFGSHISDCWGVKAGVGGPAIVWPWLYPCDRTDWLSRFIKNLRSEILLIESTRPVHPSPFVNREIRMVCLGIDDGDRIIVSLFCLVGGWGG